MLLRGEPWDLLGDCNNFAGFGTDPQRSH